MEVTIKSITTKNICEYIAEFARVCTRRDEKPSTPEQDLNRCINLWKMEHGTPFESINIDFLVEDVSRSLLAQITRYRHSSFNVESQRYCKYVEPIKFIIPEEAQNQKFSTNSVLKNMEDAYDIMIKCKVKPEDARCVLPNATPTRFRMVVNLREFFHIYKQRSNSHAQKEIYDLVELMFNKLYEEVDNNSQKLLTFMQKNVKVSIHKLIEEIEDLCFEDPYGALQELILKYKELV